MTFSTIIGHDRPVSILRRALANHTLAHAYLFSGDEGIGKKTTALALAGAVNCAAAGPDGGCGACPSCRRTAGLMHPDVHLLAPEGDEIKIDQVRAAQADLALRPFEGAVKVLIVDGAEAMNTAAANAFLKTLEEPPGESLILLVTAMPRSLLPTIRSRCQEISFLPLARTVLARVLAQRRGMSEVDASFLAALAQGSLGRALGMDGEAELTARDEVVGLWSRVRSMHEAELLTEADGLAKDRERFDRVLAIGAEWLRDAVVYHLAADEGLVVNRRRTDQLRQWGDRFSLPRMLADLDLLALSRSLLDRRVSGQLVAENLLLKLGRG